MRRATHIPGGIWLHCAIAAVVVLASVGYALMGGSKGAPVVEVTERDFKITAPARLRPGDVVLRVANRGPDHHELIVVRLGRRSQLPFRTDGLTVDEDAVERRTVGTLEPDGAGKARNLHLRLAPGRYELFCNMSGHYLGGMHRRLVVG